MISLQKCFETLLDSYAETGRTIEQFCNAFFNVDTTIRDMVINGCPNRRVVHLACFAKKKRVRKKNYNRACDYYVKK